MHYFSLYKEKGEEWYSSHFTPDTQTKYLLDASPTYLDMAENFEIPNAIKNYAPEAKIIIMIRDPIDRAISQLNHFQKVNQRDDLKGLNISDIFQILDEDLPVDDKTATAARYIRDFSFYASKIQRYIETFGTENVFVIHNEDLRAHGDQVLSSLYEFLDLSALDDEHYSEKRYVTGTHEVKVPVSLKTGLYAKYGQDYYSSCRHPGVQRPTSSDSALHLNQPVGAIVNEVGIGSDGFLFLVGGGNSPLDMLIMDNTQRSNIVKRWVDQTKIRQATLSELGIKYIQCMIPEKISILGEKLGWGLDLNKSFGDCFGVHFPNAADSPVVDLFSFFRNSPYRDQLYFKTDSHWTHVGAFGAYQNICHKLEIPFCEDLLKSTSSSGPVTFDLGAKMPWTFQEEGRFFHFGEGAKITDEGELVAFKKKHGLENDGGLHVGSFLSFEQDHAPQPESVLIFGDSFSEYRDHLLTGLLAGTFSKVSFAWTTNIDYNLVQELKPDIVICAMTERFMTAAPSDNFDLKAFAHDRVRSYKRPQE